MKIALPGRRLTEALSCLKADSLEEESRGISLCDTVAADRISALWRVANTSISRSDLSREFFEELLGVRAYGRSN